MKFSVGRAALLVFALALILAPAWLEATAGGQKKAGKKSRRSSAEAKQQTSPAKGAEAPASNTSGTPQEADNNAAGASASSPKQGTTMTNQVGIEFVYVPAGQFMMGSKTGPADERPVHKVTLRQGFYMGRVEVTQAQWQSVMGANPSKFKGEDLPVEQVSWTDAQAFIRKLNERGDAFTYRLPTEAEWEYAARAGAAEDMPHDLKATAWYFDNSLGRTHPVGEKQPNAWGLYDMHGNVWEWCEDVYHASYKGAPADGSAWVTGGDTKYRVMRGCSYMDNAFYSRMSERVRVAPDNRMAVGGLRLVAVPRQ